MANKQLWFEDFEVGKKFISEERPVHQSDVRDFAMAGGDINPLHLDPEYASRRAPFRKIVAHGELMSAIITALGAQVIGYESIILHQVTQTNFIGALYPDDYVHVEIVVSKVKDLNRKGSVTFIGKLINQNGKVIAEGSRELLIYKRPERSE